MRVMTVIGFVFNVSRRDGNTTGLLLRRLIDGSIVTEVGVTLGGLVLGDSSSESSLFASMKSAYSRRIELWRGVIVANLSMINVTNGTWIDSQQPEGQDSQATQYRKLPLN